MPLIIPAPILAPTHRRILQVELGEILLKIKRAMSHTMNVAMPTAKCRGSHRVSMCPSKGPQRPPTKNGHHRQKESFEFLPCSVMRFTIRKLSLQRSNLTPGITRRAEPLNCGRLAHESNAIRGRVHAVVRPRLPLELFTITILSNPNSNYVRIFRLRLSIILRIVVGRWLQANIISISRQPTYFARNNSTCITPREEYHEARRRRRDKSLLN